MSNPPHRLLTIGSPSSQPMMVGDCIEDFVKAHRRTTGSQRAATYALRRFARESGNPRCADLSGEHVLAWWSSLADLAPSSLRMKHSIVSCFIAWLRRRGLVCGDPMAVIPKPREPRRQPRVFAPAEVDHLMTQLDTRQRAIVALMYGVGLRCCEVAALQVDDIDWSSTTISVVGKGGHEDVLPMSRWVADHLRRYLVDSPATAGPLIRDGRWHRRAITPQRVSELMAEAIRGAGLKRHPHDGRGAHALRRTCATEMLSSGASITEVQAVLRHQSLRSTQHYLGRPDAERLRAAVERIPVV